MSDGTVGNMVDLCITESFQVKRQMLLSASEAAEMILRVDNIIKAAPRSVQSFSDHLHLFVPYYRNLLLISVCFVGSEFPTITPARGRGGWEKTNGDHFSYLSLLCSSNYIKLSNLFSLLNWLMLSNHQTQLPSVALLMLANAVQFQHKVKMRSLCFCFLC